MPRQNATATIEDEDDLTLAIQFRNALVSKGIIEDGDTVKLRRKKNKQGGDKVRKPENLYIEVNGVSTTNLKGIVYPDLKYSYSFHNNATSPIIMHRHLKWFTSGGSAAVRHLDSFNVTSNAEGKFECSKTAEKYIVRSILATSEEQLKEESKLIEVRKVLHPDANEFVLPSTSTRNRTITIGGEKTRDQTIRPSESKLRSIQVYRGKVLFDIVNENKPPNTVQINSIYKNLLKQAIKLKAAGYLQADIKLENIAVEGWTEGKKDTAGLKATLIDLSAVNINDFNNKAISSYIIKNTFTSSFLPHNNLSKNSKPPPLTDRFLCKLFAHKLPDHLLRTTLGLMIKMNDNENIACDSSFLNWAKYNPFTDTYQSAYEYNHESPSAENQLEIMTILENNPSLDTHDNFYYKDGTARTANDANLMVMVAKDKASKNLTYIAKDSINSKNTAFKFYEQLIETAESKNKSLLCQQAMDSQFATEHRITPNKWANRQDKKTNFYLKFKQLKEHYDSETPPSEKPAMDYQAKSVKDNICSFFGRTQTKQATTAAEQTPQAQRSDSLST